MGNKDGTFLGRLKTPKLTLVFAETIDRPVPSLWSSYSVFQVAIFSGTN
jgi:hypothetical protein